MTDTYEINGRRFAPDEYRVGDTPLRPLERDVLLLLCKYAGKLTPYHIILDSVEASHTMIRIVIHDLRRKLGEPNPIRMVRGRGYIISAVVTPVTA